MPEETATITAELSDLEEAVFAIGDLSEALTADVYGYKLSGILSSSKGLSEAENARKFVIESYERTRTTLRAIAALSKILTIALSNGEIKIGGACNE